MIFAIPISTTPPPSMFEHFDFIWFLGVLALGIIVFFAIRALTKIEKNQDEIFKRLQANETELAFLQGEHKSMCSGMLPLLQSINTKLSDLSPE